MKLRILVGLLCIAQLAMAQDAARTDEPADAIQTFTVDSFDGVPISYRRAGRGELALLFVHGWSCDASHWAVQLASLRDRYTVVALDLAGHGQSGAKRKAWTMASFGEDVRAVARRLPNEHLVLVGHSMGGAVVLEAAAGMPERVIGVVGVDTFHRVGQPVPDDAEIERRVRAYRADFAGIVGSMVGRWFGPRASDELKTRLTAQFTQTSPDIAIPAMTAFVRMDYADVLARVHVPITAINSDRVPLDVERIRALAPRFELRVMPGTGHFVMLEDPAGFERILEQTVHRMRERFSAGPVIDGER